MPSEIPAKAYFLSSSRILLRPPKESDLDELWPHFSNPKITTFLAWNRHKTIEASRDVLLSLIKQQTFGTGYHWVVMTKKQIIGIVSLIDVIRNLRAWRVDRAELAYWISPDVQKKGYATEASSLVCGFAFDILHLHKILIYHAKNNLASRRVAEKLGARYVGTLKDGFMKEGKWHDFGLYELIKTPQKILSKKNCDKIYTS